MHAGSTGKTTHTVYATVSAQFHSMALIIYSLTGLQTKHSPSEKILGHSQRIWQENSW